MKRDGEKALPPVMGRVLIIALFAAAVFVLGVNLDGRWGVGIPLLAEQFGSGRFESEAEAKRNHRLPVLPESGDLASLADAIVRRGGDRWSNDSLELSLVNDKIALLRGDPDVEKAFLLIDGHLVEAGWKRSAEKERSDASLFQSYLRQGATLFVNVEAEGEWTACAIVLSDLADAGGRGE